MTKLLTFLLLMALTISVFAQKQYTISGVIQDETTGEQLIGATIKVKGVPRAGTSSNSYGFYSLSQPPGNIVLEISYIGYVTVTRDIDLNQNQTLNITLPAQGILNEVVIKANKPNNDNVAAPEMGLQKLSMAQINNVPVVMGERDALKTLSLLPGVKSAGEGNTGFYVRGGSADQNLILLDEATVYNASHLFGFFSTFNSDAVKDISLYKGTIPANYGGRLSSVLDIKMNEGNNKNLTFQGGIGLIASRLKIEAPLIKNKGSFMISGRRTYVDLFLKASTDPDVKDNILYFYDLNAKANYHFDDKNALYLSGYFGKDVLGLKNTFGVDWGNATGTLRYNHVFNNKLFSNTSFIVSNYSYAVTSFLSDKDFKVTSQITDINFKEDMQYIAGLHHTFKFGINVLYHSMAPGNISASAGSGVNSQAIEKRYGLENALYMSDEWKVNSKLTLLYGLRASNFLLLGAGTFNTYDSSGNISSSQTYDSGDVVKSYFNLEPRFSASYAFDEQNSIKAAYNRNTQNIHLLNSSTFNNPTSLYVMSGNNIKPEIADQVSTGYFKNFNEDIFECSVELYYKWLQNQIDYRNGAQLVFNKSVESELLYGTGRAYGIELFIKKKQGRLNGWFGYTLSRTERKINGINDGNYYPASQDRTHDLSLVSIYQLNDRWTFSSTFIYSSGNAATFPTGKYNVGGLTTYSYSSRNSERMPVSHRLDIGATLNAKKNRKYQSSWTFSVYNAYAYWSPYAINFQKNTNTGLDEAVQISIFAVPIPSVTWNFKF